jgi:hypothetical protein
VAGQAGWALEPSSWTATAFEARAAAAAAEVHGPPPSQGGAVGCWAITASAGRSVGKVS